MRCQYCDNMDKLHREQDETITCGPCLYGEFIDHIGSNPDFNYSESEFHAWLEDMSLVND